MVEGFLGFVLVFLVYLAAVMIFAQAVVLILVTIFPDGPPWNR